MKKTNKFWNFSENENNERTLYLNGVIAEESWIEDDVTPKLFRKELESGVGDITLWINSPGGDVFAAVQIYNMLKDYEGGVTVKIDAIAASAASMIAMAGDTVYMSPLSMLMIHNPETLAVGNKEDMEKTCEMLDEIKEAIINAYESKTGLSRDVISELMDNETWFSANKAVALGFADGILFNEKAKQPNAGEKETEIKEDNKETEENQDKQIKNASDFIYSPKIAANSKKKGKTIKVLQDRLSLIK